MRLQIPGTEWVNGEIPSSAPAPAQFNPHRERSLEQEAEPRRVTPPPRPKALDEKIAREREDRRLFEEVCEALLHDTEIDASAIEVRVQSRVVTLEGRVPNREMKRQAEDLANAIVGVVDTQNRLTF